MSARGSSPTRSTSPQLVDAAAGPEARRARLLVNSCSSGTTLDGGTDSASTWFGGQGSIWMLQQDAGSADHVGIQHPAHEGASGDQQSCRRTALGQADATSFCKPVWSAN